MGDRFVATVLYINYYGFKICKVCAPLFAFVFKIIRLKLFKDLNFKKINLALVD